MGTGPQLAATQVAPEWGTPLSPIQFFRVRLWDQDMLIKELRERYNNLDEDLRAELPLKRIWTVAAPDEED